MRITNKLALFIDQQGKRKTLRHLKLLSERQLIDCGYSPQLLSEGVKAWPWREESENFVPLQLEQPLSQLLRSQNSPRNITMEVADQTQTHKSAA